MRKKDKSKQIKIAFQLDQWGLIMLWTSVLIMMICLLYVNWNYASLPERIPIHFDFTGNIDGYGPKSFLLIFSLLMMLTISGILWLAFYPERFNYPKMITDKNRMAQYQNGSNLLLWTALSCSVLLLLIDMQMIHIAKGLAPNDYMAMIIINMILMMLGIAYFVRRSFQLG